MEKYVPKIVAVIGGMGLGSALAYFVGVFLAFRPGWGAWSEFFIGRAIVLMLVPYVLLTAYLYARSRLGSWLVERGAYEEAIEYTETRLKASLLRSKKETHLHRLALARAHASQFDYAEAYRVLTKGYAVPKSGRQALDIHRWRMEVALRMEDLVRCRETFQRIRDAARPAASRVYVLGCRLEVAVREENRRDYERFLDEAEWIELDCYRVDLSQAIGLIVFSDEKEDLELALGLLETTFEDAVADIPGRRGGLLAWRSRALAGLGRLEDARNLFEQAQNADSDSRSEYVIDQAAKVIDMTSQID